MNKIANPSITQILGAFENQKTKNKIMTFSIIMRRIQDPIQHLWWNYSIKHLWWSYSRNIIKGLLVNLSYHLQTSRTSIFTSSEGMKQNSVNSKLAFSVTVKFRYL